MKMFRPKPDKPFLMEASSVAHWFLDRHPEWFNKDGRYRGWNYDYVEFALSGFIYSGEVPKPVGDFDATFACERFREEAGDWFEVVEVER